MNERHESREIRNVPVPCLLVLALLLSPAPGVAERWLAELDQVWILARDEFHDPELDGVDWVAARRRHEPAVRAAKSHEEAARAINALLAELRTSHTRYFTDADPAYYFLLDLFRRAPVGRVIPKRFPNADVSYVGIGVFTERIDDAVFVRAVVDGGPAHEAGLLAGDRIVSVDGEPWRPIRAGAVEGRAWTVRIQQSPDASSRRDVAVVPRRIRPTEFLLEAMRASARVIERDGVTVAYVRPWSYAGSAVQELLEDLVLRGDLSQADALVIDLRDGWGGASPAYVNLFNDRVSVLTYHRRGREPVRFDSQWRKPVSLLVDEHSRSGKELLAHSFRRHGHGPVIGARTAGAVSAGKAFAIGDAGLLYLAVSDVLVDGERLERVGVAPDVEVPFDLPHAQGDDPRLERALTMMVDAVRSQSPER